MLFGLYGPGGGVGSDRFESGCGALGWCVSCGGRGVEGLVGWRELFGCSGW